MNRRLFLLAGSGIAGALIVGWGVRPPRARLNADAEPLPLARGEVQLNGWLKISAEGLVTVAVPRAEMGQGVYTALPMLVAEELGCDWSQVAFAQAPVDKMYGNVEVMAANAAGHPDEVGTTFPEIKAWIARKVGRELGIMMTGGSSSVKDAWLPLRSAGAAARDMLIQAAAIRFKADAKDCKAVKGWIVHGSGLKASFGELAGAAAGLVPSLPIKLKEVKDFTLIGKNLPRLDTRAKVTGQAEFGLDVRLPNMLYATIRMAPVFGAGWTKFYANHAEGMPGVKAVLPINPGMAGVQCGIGVIAEAWWQAKRAADVLDIVWDTEPGKQHGQTSAGLDSAAIFRDYREAIDSGSADTYFSRGKMGEALALSTQEVSAEYRVPFLAHGTLEPQNCTAWIRDDGEVEVWAPTQAPSIAQWIAAKAAGVKTHQVTVHSTFLGGGFGRRGEMDMVVQAVVLAKTTAGRPVQLIWSREEDTTHDMYRPAALAQLTAGLDGAGNVVWWRSKSASGSVIHSITARLGFPPVGPDRSSAEGLSDKVYEIPHVRIEHAQVNHPVPLGPWRSVGHSQNAFFAEHFLDECAAKTGKDPLDYRRNLLKNHPRHLAVLNLAAEKAGWGKPLPAGRARGVALHESFGSIVAQVAEVSIEDKKPRVHRVVCAIDCGVVVNPDIVAQQMESGIIYGLTATLYGEITIEAGAVRQKNFDSYALLGMKDAPQVETYAVVSAAAPGGVGEPATPPVAPAVANALLRLTGNPVRALPVKL